MRTPIVTEIAHPMEWITPDTFIEGSGSQSTPRGLTAGTQLSGGRDEAANHRRRRRIDFRKLARVRPR